MLSLLSAVTPNQLYIFTFFYGEDSPLLPNSVQLSIGTMDSALIDGTPMSEGYK